MACRPHALPEGCGVAQTVLSAEQRRVARLKGLMRRVLAEAQGDASLQLQVPCLPSINLGPSLTTSYSPEQSSSCLRLQS